MANNEADEILEKLYQRLNAIFEVTTDDNKDSGENKKFSDKQNLIDASTIAHEALSDIEAIHPEWKPQRSPDEFKRMKG